MLGHLILLCALGLGTNAGAQSPESLRQGAAAFPAGLPPAETGTPPPQAGPGRAVERESAPQEGPEAVLDFERSFRGPKNKDYKGCCHLDKPHPPARRRREEEAYPEAKPIPLSGLKNIQPMTQKLWTPRQLQEDFAKNKAEGQEAILVIVKTEACQLNEHRVCAAATAALEKRSTPLLAKFRVYGAWIRNNPGSQGRDWLRWEEDIADAYRFKQGPGAKIVVLLPGVDRPFESDAGQLGLTVEALEKNKGKTPLLETFLKNALDSAPHLRRTKKD